MAIRTKINFTSLAFRQLKPLLFNAEEIATEQPDRYSYLGTPVLDGIQILAGNYKDTEGNIISYPELTVDSVVMQVDFSKNIIETVLQGRDGSIKEYVSTNDFEVQITGLLDDGTGVFPETSLSAFNQIIEAPQSVEIVSNFLNFMGVTDIVIRRANLSNSNRQRNIILFDMDCIQDREINLEENAEAQ